MSTSPILIMAGGTGGHVFPALAIAQALRAKGINVHWLGTTHGLEARVIPPTEIPLHFITISGLRGKGIMKLLTAPFSIARAIFQTIHILRTIKPRAVIGMGGFVTVGGIAAWLLRIPLFLHEQNAIAGMTNRWLARLATRVMQGFPTAFPPAYHAVYTGNPVRAAIQQLSKLPPRQQTRKPLQILVLGGSLGAKALNETLPATLALLKHPITLWHQTGTQHIAATKAAYAQQTIPVQISDFIEDMAAAYQWADVVICRAGAMTLSELTLAGVGSVLIPFPHAVDDHQTINAEFLVKQGAALLLPQTELTPARLAVLLDDWSEHPEKLIDMATAARRAAMPEALENVLKEIGV